MFPFSKFFHFYFFLMDVNELFLDGILHAWQPFYCVCKISQPFAQFVKKMD